MKSSSVIALFVMMFLTSLTITRAMSLRSLGVELHCRCIQTESRPIGRHIKSVELIPANSHCQDTEIIATLKKDDVKVCLDPKAPWVKKVIQKIISNKEKATRKDLPSTNMPLLVQ
ncbi:interleukin-8-like [Cyprinodon tularosa]|uniref:interleukin-8-like n=1 Tax=Cyprinodon tularosa TaxID=77115 RepID=UPI0018E253A3|nr:interleukin-8-like [Cyprinodon tularosa]